MNLTEPGEPSRAGKSSWGRGFWSDVKYAARTLMAAPLFTAVAVATLGIGIGATTAVFTAVYAVMLKPLPYPESERLVRVMMTVPSTNPAIPARRVPLVLTRSERAEILSKVSVLTHAAASAPTFANWVGREPRLQGARVSASVFPMVGQTPLLGRVLTDADEAPGARVCLAFTRSARIVRIARPLGCGFPLFGPLIGR